LSVSPLPAIARLLVSVWHPPFPSRVSSWHERKEVVRYT